MARPLPYHSSAAGQSPIDLTSMLNVCPVDERNLWDAISELLVEAAYVEAFEIHLEPERDCLRVRYRSVFDFSEIRVEGDAVLLEAVTLLASRLWSDENTHVAKRGWFLINVSTTPTLFQLDSAPCSTGATFMMTKLDDVIQQPARIEDIGLSRHQLTKLKSALQHKTGLIVVASELPQVHRRTSRAIAQNLVSPDVKVIMADTPMHPRIPGTTQLGMDFPATIDQINNWQGLCQMSADAIVATQTLDAELGKQLIDLAAEKSLVVSSIDAISASSCLARLLGLGVGSETLAHCLHTVVLQYRVRCLCTYCRVGVSPDDAGTQWLAQYSPIQAGNINDWLRHRMRASFSDASGCAQCDDTGHRTWLDVFDVITVSREVKEALFDADYQFAMTQIQQLQSLPEKLLKLAQEGIISLSEAARLTDGLAVV